MEVFLVAQTKLTDAFGLGHVNWMDTEARDPDLLVETAGRLCYKSWAPPYDTELNPNEQYIKNILQSGCGSVLEHVNFTFVLRGVSCMLTHELVRHRAGCAYSQEFLKLENLEVISPEFHGNEVNTIMSNTVEVIKTAIKQLNELLLSDEQPMHLKKQLTSYIRRIAPIGIKTSIMFTVNARALRHIIEQRTSLSAETEIRQCFREVARIVRHQAPAIFQDMKENCDGEITFANKKV